MPLILSLTQTVPVNIASQGTSHQSFVTFGDRGHYAIHKPCLVSLVNLVQHTAGVSL